MSPQPPVPATPPAPIRLRVSRERFKLGDEISLSPNDQLFFLELSTDNNLTTWANFIILRTVSGA